MLRLLNRFNIFTRAQAIRAVEAGMREGRRQALEDGMTFDETRDSVFMHLEKNEQIGLALEIIAKLSDEDMEYVRSLGGNPTGAEPPPPQSRAVERVQQVARWRRGQRDLDLD